MIQVWLRTKFNGFLIGEDQFGNKYYEEKFLLFKRGNKFGQKRLKRRWVVYNADSDGSHVPPKWHGWIHRTGDGLPPNNNHLYHPWEKDHLPNLTGTASAYRPKGSLMGIEKVKGDYEAWTPNN